MIGHFKGATVEEARPETARPMVPLREEVVIYSRPLEYHRAFEQLW